MRTSMSLSGAACGLAAVLLLAAPGVWAAAGMVQAVTGTARIIPASGLERPALKGDNLYSGDTVTTSAGSQVQIRMVDDARIWLRPSSRFKIEQYPADAASALQPQAQAAIRLIEGSLRTATGAIGQAAPERYSFKTPNAVISVRGTDFEAAYVGARVAAQMQAAAGTYHRVFQGMTMMAMPGGPMLPVRQGESVFIGLEPADQPRPLPQMPAFLNLPDPEAAAPPVARRESTSPPGRAIRLGLRMASPLADGAVVVSSAGAPVEPIQTTVPGREGETARLMLSIPPPPSSRQRRAPEPPTQVVLDMSARLQGDQAVVQVQSPGQPGSATVTIPLGVWTDISGRASWLAGGRQTISSSSARPESAQVLVRVDLAAP